MTAVVSPTVSKGALVDSFGRVATDLRISLTDRCNLRCTYCMPAEGLKWLPKLTLLTEDEYVRLAQLFVSMGVTTVRLTGGEPLLYPSLPSLVARLKALGVEVALTTNGIGLDGRAAELVSAGLDRINVSVDTLDRSRFVELTRRDRLDDVLAGVAAARDAGMAPVKVNSVLMRDSNLSEAPALLDWALREGFELRFIEHMPLDAQHEWSRSAMVTAEEVLALLARDYVLEPAGHGADGHAPAEDFAVLDGPSRSSWALAQPTVGIIASVTRPFCRDCDRLRLTGDGQLRTCLFATSETDLRGPLRGGASDDELASLITVAVAGKQAGHHVNEADFVQPVRPMSAIGG